MKLEEIQEQLKVYFKDLDDICTENNIEYWADGGTLLGAVRNNGIIPHDDDGDICMYEPEFNKFKNIIEKDYPQYVIYSTDGLLFKLMRREYPYVWIDIFFVENHETLVRYKIRRHRSVWPKFYHQKTDVFPLQRIAFEDMMIWIPNNPIPYLERGYGSNWKTPMVVHTKHTPIHIP